MSRQSENPTASEDAGRVPRPDFTPEQRKILLQIAHDSILTSFKGSSLTDEPPRSADESAGLWMMEPRGVFCTLYLKGGLRGCVGYATAIRPLYRAVAETARAAAFDDSRFSPVKEEEAGELKISLSVLSPLFPIRAEEVEVGRHGLMISDGMRRGLLLPQVPVEHGWDRKTFLQQTCRKAGLPLDAWQRFASIDAFTAEVFGEESGVVN